LKLEGFQYATSLDQNVGYYHIELSPHAKQLCTIVFYWVNLNSNTYQWAYVIAQKCFQDKMSCLMDDLEYVQSYIDDPLIITKGTYLEHVQKLATVLTRLQLAGLK
jgi:hypothetical protein